ncbi:MAG: hypothetical protein ACRDFC_00375 [Ignavibacteria bacterium]
MKLSNISFKVLLSLFLLFFISSGIADAQVKKKSKKWRSPTFSVDIAGSYNLPLQEIKGEIADFFTFKNYGTNIGWGAQFNVKFGLGRYGQYRPYVTLGYAQFQNSDDNRAYIDSNRIFYGYPLRDSAVYKDTTGTSEIFFRIPYIGGGFEYAFTTADRRNRAFIPFIGVEFVMSVITGVYRQIPTGTPSGNFQNQEVSFNIKPDVRLGIGGSIGAHIRFTKAFGIVFGGKYKFANLIGKKSDWLLEENKMNLLDEAATDLNKRLSEDRNIGFMEFYLGATIFVGRTRK